MASRNPLLHARRRQARLLGGPVDVAIDGSEQCLVARQAIPRGAVVFRERPLACCPDHPPKAGATDALTCAHCMAPAGTLLEQLVYLAQAADPLGPPLPTHVVAASGCEHGPLYRCPRGCKDVFCSSRCAAAAEASYHYCLCTRASDAAATFTRLALLHAPEHSLLAARCLVATATAAASENTDGENGGRDQPSRASAEEDATSGTTSGADPILFGALMASPATREQESGADGRLGSQSGGLSSGLSGGLSGAPFEATISASELSELGFRGWDPARAHVADLALALAAAAQAAATHAAAAEAVSNQSAVGELSGPADPSVAHPSPSRPSPSEPPSSRVSPSEPPSSRASPLAAVEARVVARVADLVCLQLGQSLPASHVSEAVPAVSCSPEHMPTEEKPTVAKEEKAAQEKATEEKAAEEKATEEKAAVKKAPQIDRAQEAARGAVGLGWILGQIRLNVRSRFSCRPHLSTCRLVLGEGRDRVGVRLGHP